MSPATWQTSSIHQSPDATSGHHGTHGRPYQSLPGGSSNLFALQGCVGQEQQYYAALTYILKFQWLATAIHGSLKPHVHHSSSEMALSANTTQARPVGAQPGTGRKGKRERPLASISV